MCALSIVLGPSSAQAFGLRDRPTHWPRGRTVEFVVNLANVPAAFPREQYLEYLRKAVAAWRAIETVDLPFVIGSTLTDETKIEPQEDGMNMIFWKPNFVPHDQFAGKAYPYDKECDILLAPKSPVTLLDVQAIIMHELGHCMGLAHSTATSIMTKFQGLPSIGYDDMIALTLLYPDQTRPLATATITGKVTCHGQPLVGAVLRVMDTRTQRIVLAGFSGLIDRQRRLDASGRFELPGLPLGPTVLKVEPMDAFAAANPSGYGAPMDTPPPSFQPLQVTIPALKAGTVHDLGTLTVESR